MKKLLLTIAGLLVMSSLALAQSTPDTTNATGTSGTTVRQARKNAQPHGGIACGSDPILPTDGAAIQDFVDISSSSYYLVHLKGGHSYSAEMYDSTDATISAAGQLVLTSTTDCTTVLPTTDVTAYDPDLSINFAARISWIQPTPDSDAVLKVTNTDPVNSYLYMIRITDTTLHNPRWSTFLGFSTQYAFVNNTESSITGTLTVYDNAGSVVISTPAVIVPAGAESFQTVNSPANKFGFSTFAFVGPAGAITADAYFLNGSTTIIVPSTFAPRNYQH